MHEEFRSNADILLKLKLEDKLTSGFDDLDYTLEVNGAVIYYMMPRPGGRNTFKVRQSVLGPIISIPALYPQRYVYEHDHYVDEGGRV